MGDRKEKVVAGGEKRKKMVVGREEGVREGKEDDKREANLSWIQERGKPCDGMTEDIGEACLLGWWQNL